MEKHSIDAEKELEELLVALSLRNDPADLRRARELADEIRQGMRQKYGPRDIAVELVRAARDGE